MRSHTLTLVGQRLTRLRSNRKVNAVAFWVMVALAPILALATFAVLGDPGGYSMARHLAGRGLGHVLFRSPHRRHVPVAALARGRLCLHAPRLLAEALAWMCR